VAACGDAGTSPTTDADAGTDATTAGTSPTTDADAGTDATTASCASEGGDSSTTADASTSAGSSSTSDASSGEGSGGGDGSSSTGEPAPVPTACFGTPCTDSAECLPGLRCMTHPETGEGMCVTTCLAAPPIFCDVEAVSCGAFIPKVAPVECIDGGCFPAVCVVLADCPAGSVACDAGLCY
jgi:hypothetical protein